MKLIGRLACLAAILGLFCQFLEVSPVFVVDDSDHAEVASGAGDCGGDSHESHCPKEPLHDHCGSFCGHFFTAVPDSSERFSIHRSSITSLQAVIQEAAVEGFPAGLFIPPRLS